MQVSELEATIETGEKQFGRASLNLGQQLGWLLRDIYEPFQFVFDFIGGFFDNGKSFDDAIEILR